ncbi:hypothetical protein B9Z55_020375 [Caenorhabditis nigoni]|uniref:Glutaredoxin domain-containing protein n=1 Tax=Caenorhabditis nigoni TaxID=1611254 RepID=A0A2G5TMH5_9PELO|nr:hypothetical protein B9Z55_020375 [Caenorhabditis nigoni]
MGQKTSLPENKETSSSTTPELGATPEIASSNLAEDELENVSAANKNDSEVEFDYRKVEERQNEFEAEMERENEVHRAEMETIRRNTLLLDEENRIRMNPIGPMIAEVEIIIKKNRNVLFTSREAEEENRKISSLLNSTNNEFKTVYVEDDAVIRLGVKELTSKEEFPLLFIDGHLKDTSEFEQECLDNSYSILTYPPQLSE